MIGGAFPYPEFLGIMIFLRYMIFPFLELVLPTILMVPLPLLAASPMLIQNPTQRLGRHPLLPNIGCMRNWPGRQSFIAIPFPIDGDWKIDGSVILEKPISTTGSDTGCNTKGRSTKVRL